MERKKTILLVEDEAIIAMNEARILENYGYRVISEYNARSAIERVRKEPIDLVLMDIDLGKGKMDGIEAAEFILKEHSTVPIVFLSSHTEKEFVEKIEGITSYGYILKNSGETVLVASLKMAFKLFDALNTVRLREIETREIVDNISSAILKFDADGNIIYFSRGAEKIFGYSAEEVIGRQSIDTINPKIDTAGNDHREMLKDIFSNIEEYSVHENENVSKDGTPLWMSWKNSVVYDEKGDVLYVQSIADDITKVKQQEENFRTLIENLDDIIYSVDVKTEEFRYLSPAFRRVLGYSLEDVEAIGGRKVFLSQIIQEDGFEKHMEVLRGAKEDDSRHVPLVSQWKAKDGTVKTMEDYWVPVYKNGKLERTEGVLRDITERKRIEEHLKSVLEEKTLLLQKLNHIKMKEPD